jgi:peptidoglycan/xylan/chitin deacetylase (PgdA/CDA1 family)
MHQKFRIRIALMCVISAVGIAVVNVAAQKSSAPQAPAVLKTGSTQVARWKDDKKAAFLLMFDDSVPSHFKTVIPELQKRGLRATFYVNPGADRWLSAKDKWEREIPAIPGMVYANHTWTHNGIVSPQNAEAEIGETNAMLLKLFSGKQRRLISFGRPGVKPEQWKISEADLNRVLDRHYLVERPRTVAMAMITAKTSDEMLGLADKAIAAGSMDGIVFHGVGAEWIVTPTEMFTALLDGLQARRDKLWITDHISAHQYQTERDGATVEVQESSTRRLRLRLQTTASPQFYDLPLTLITQVPTRWKKCEVVQGSRKTVVAAGNSKLLFEALPNGEPITVRPLAN